MDQAALYRRTALINNLSPEIHPSKTKHNVYLRDQPVEVGVCWPLNVQGPAADIIDGLVVEQHSNVSVLQKGVSGQDTVVGLHNCSRHLTAERRDVSTNLSYPSTVRCARQSS